MSLVSVVYVYVYVGCVLGCIRPEYSSNVLAGSDKWCCSVVYLLLHPRIRQSRKKRQKQNDTSKLLNNPSRAKSQR